MLSTMVTRKKTKDISIYFSSLTLFFLVTFILTFGHVLGGAKICEVVHLPISMLFLKKKLVLIGEEYRSLRTVRARE